MAELTRDLIIHHDHDYLENAFMALVPDPRSLSTHTDFHSFSTDHHLHNVVADHHHHRQVVLQSSPPLNGYNKGLMCGGKKRKRNNNNTNNNQNDVAKPNDVVHVRAKRGQATDSHSLAERVRREKINERLRCLQDLVPGCYKTMGMAVMLDVIINYVQSLQNQIEFLSMKLSAASMYFDFNSLDMETVQTTNGYQVEVPDTQRKAMEEIGDNHPYFHSTFPL